jgi:hypothetical protein
MKTLAVLHRIFIGIFFGTALMYVAASLALPTCSYAAEIDARLDTLFGSHQPYETFLASLQTMANAQDWHAIAASVAYPLKVTLGGHRTRLRTAEDFLSHRDAIMNSRVIAAIKRQTYSALFANSSGAMIGDGEIWFSGVCKNSGCTDPPLKIIAINP